MVSLALTTVHLQLYLCILLPEHADFLAETSLSLTHPQAPQTSLSHVPQLFHAGDSGGRSHPLPAKPSLLAGKQARWWSMSWGWLKQLKFITLAPYGRCLGNFYSLRVRLLSEHVFSRALGEHIVLPVGMPPFWSDASQWVVCGLWLFRSG